MKYACVTFNYYKMVLFMLFFVILFIFILFSWINVIWQSKKINVPALFPLPIVGNGLLFAGGTSEMLKVLSQIENKYDGVVLIHLLSERCLIVTDPKIVEEIVTNPVTMDKAKAYDIASPWLGKGLLTSSGDKWRSHRKLLTPAFHFNMLQSFLPVMLSNQRILVSHLRSLAGGSPFNLVPIIAAAALDTLAESVMGVSLHAQDDYENNEFVKSIAILSKLMATRWANFFLKHDFFFNLTSYKKIQDDALKVVNDQTSKVLAARCQELKQQNLTSLKDTESTGYYGKNKKTFLDIMLTPDSNGVNMDERSLRDEVNTFMFAGYDTVTTVISFTLYCIAKYEKVQDKIYLEQQAIFGDNILRDPTYNEIQSMKYTELVLKETLRLYPAAPYILRAVKQDTTISGINLTKDTTILIDAFNMQRSPKVFEKPLEFRPERFENKLHTFSSLPFSAGPRNCIGQKYAMMQLKTIISSIIRNFVVLPSGIEPIITADCVLKSTNGVHLILKKRN